MLGFLRKHQKYFYFVITIVIVISFSFFGTYTTLTGNSIHEQIAFTAIDGTEISRSELEEFALFLGTDQDDSRLYAGAIGPNFLNNGVIKKDFLETGLARILIQAYSSDLRGDLATRHAKEVKFKPYTHPEANFVGSKVIWAYFAPEIPANLELLQNAKDPLSEEALNAKISLYLAEKRFPAPYLRQILLRQEQQYGWIPHDQALESQELALFGYRNLDDWFGSKFTRLISEFIINCSKIAEKKGYVVSKEEALADLMRNAQVNFKEHASKGHFNAKNYGDYLEQQLLRMRMDRPKAVKIWQKILLFRRLFQDVGNAVFVDRSIYDAFNKFAGETTLGDLYQLPKALRFSDFTSLIRFETYLDAVSKRSKEEKSSPDLPKVFYSAAEVEKRHPELAEKRYQLEIASVNKKKLSTRVGVKETLSWEIDEKNWKLLINKFPELGIKNGSTRDERLEALDSLDNLTRTRVDSFARAAIVDENSKWIEEALKASPKRLENVSIVFKGENSAFRGLKDGSKLIALLDKAPLNEESSALSKISFDGENFYAIKVVERIPGSEIVAFGKANVEALDELADQKLEPYYVQIRQNNPDKFQNSDKSWKSLQEVRELVAESYFEPLLKALKKESLSKEVLTNDQASALRFLSLIKKKRSEIEKNPSGDQFVNASEQAASFSDQWKLEKSPLQVKREGSNQIAHHNELFKLPINTYSKIYEEPNGDLFFVFVKEKADQVSKQSIEEQIARARFLLSSEAEQMLLYKLLPELKAKNAISFNYLYADTPSMEKEITPPSES